MSGDGQGLGAADVDRLGNVVVARSEADLPATQTFDPVDGRLDGERTAVVPISGHAGGAFASNVARGSGRPGVAAILEAVLEIAYAEAAIMMVNATGRCVVQIFNGAVGRTGSEIPEIGCFQRCLAGIPSERNSDAVLENEGVAGRRHWNVARAPGCVQSRPNGGPIARVDLASLIPPTDSGVT